VGLSEIFDLCLLTASSAQTLHDMLEVGMKRMEATAIVPESRVLDLLQIAGLGDVLTFYGSYLLRGWVATKM
jgi:hypothetical protein